MSARADTEAPRKIGRYVLHAPIGAGGMATVHLGRLFGPRGFTRIVAIKRLHAVYAEDPELVVRFMQEARLASRIRHPNVVPVLDVIAEDGELSLVMEYVEGESLARLLRAARERGETVPVPVAAAIVAGVLQGLHAAHTSTGEDGEPLGVVHRDVSPQNVILGADGVPRLLDFGVAKAIGISPATRGAGGMGKLAYMAPEQVRREPVSMRTDVYAASVVLWEMICGRRLFCGEDEADVAEQVLIGLVPPPSKHVPAIDDAIEAIVLKGLASDAQQRPDALAMAHALEPFAALRSTVTTWFNALASEGVAQRAALVRSVERAEPPRTSNEDPVTTRRTGRGWIVGASAVALVVTIAALSSSLAARSGGAAPRASASALVSAAGPPPNAAAVVAPSASSSSFALPTPSETPKAASAAPRSPAAAAARSAPARSAAPAASTRRCESIDPVTGDIHFDRDCK